MDILQDNHESKEERNFSLFSDHLNIQYRNLKNSTNTADVGGRANTPSPSTNELSNSCSGEGPNSASDTSATAFSCQDNISKEEENLKNLIPIMRPSTTNKNGRANVSLIVGDLNRTGPLAEMIARQTVAHRLQVCRAEDAYMFCNKEAYSMIWILVNLPASQDLLSLTTSIRYFSKFNKDTAVIGISSTKCDVDLRLHGIDEILLQPINTFLVQQEYKKWTLVQINPAELLNENITQRNMFMGNAVPNSADFCKLPVSVRSAIPLSERPSDSKPPQTSYVIRQTRATDSMDSSSGSSKTHSDHTTKEKLRRERIKESCDQLRVLLPYIRGRKTDMASVLEMCVDYLKLINAVLPVETRHQIMNFLGKECNIFGQSLQVGPNNPVGSLMFSQLNCSNYPTENTKSIRASSQTLFQPDSNKEDISRLNDPGRQNLIIDRNEFSTLGNATNDSFVPEQARKDSTFQCNKHKRPRLKDSWSMENLPNHSDPTEHPPKQNLTHCPSFLSTNMHNPGCTTATDMRKNSNLINPWQFASTSAHIPCSGYLLNKASDNRSMNDELPVSNHFRTASLNPQQQAHSHLQQDSSLPSCYPIEQITCDDRKLNSLNTSAAQTGYGDHYQSNNLRTCSHFPQGRQSETTTSTDRLPLMEAVADGDTTKRCESSRHSALANTPKRTIDQLSGEKPETVT